ncbi:DUF3097 domain-containing protein [Actinomyces sp.]|uniref:DUF3097 domain-containing protein n=1 Tax=Actinomyces sp. TaxID=29317 RepID=UPI0026DA849D|nr:DUF3097 domain-containing protein [Actinomyces sp.]MDO4899810.1 DUF3097 domain-containing protein [Actinomyces sp.]
MNTSPPRRSGPIPGATAARRQALREQAARQQARAEAQSASDGARKAGGAGRTPQRATTPRPSAHNRYGGDVLSVDPHRVGPTAMRPESEHVALMRGMVLEDRQTGFVGAAVAVEKSGGKHLVVLEDRRGVRRAFPLGPGFWLEGRPVIVDPPTPRKRPPAGPVSAGGRRLTASGSYAVKDERARVARASRIWVEGKHDAELVEKVWGDDLRHEGVVVLMLDGVDNLEEVMADFKPSPQRRAGVLVDHLVPGSKESRVAERVRAMPGGEHVLILGHPYVDVWQAVRPERVGLRAWPEIPRGTDIKHGTLEALGWPHADQADIAHGWQRILATVRSYKDLEPSLLGRMEELIDFVTAPGTR